MRLRCFRKREWQLMLDVMRQFALWLTAIALLMGISLRGDRVLRADELPSAAAVTVPLKELVSSPSSWPGLPPERATMELPAWWLDESMMPMRSDASVLPLSLESLLVRAVTHSSQIKVFSELPLIRRTTVTEADAAFDWAAFLDSRWDDTNEPAGSLLTGASKRYRNNQFTTTAGARRRTFSGGLFEAGQELGGQQTNSIYFQPNPQGTSRLKLSYVHPILRGSGAVYNVSLSCLALVDTSVAEAEFSREVQSHLVEVARACWGLHLARAGFVIQNRSLNRSREVCVRLQDRREVDAVRPQILRAQAEVAARESQLTRAEMTVRAAEAMIRSLVNDPELGTWSTTEIVLLDTPSATEVPVDMQRACEAALEHRPEVCQALDQIRAACIRLQMSKNEMLPVLNVVTEAYVAGLQNHASVGDAWLDQFRTGGPGAAAGLEFEVPLGQRAARAQCDRRVIECRQLRNQYETILHSLRLEVGVSVREVKASWSELLARKIAVEAHQTQLDATTERWKLLPGEDGSGALMLEKMLRDQDRLTRAELSLLEAWISYNMALFALRKATGELLQTEQVTWTDYRGACDSLPVRTVSKPDSKVDARSFEGTLYRSPLPQHAD